MQTTSNILMIRPAAFCYNAETAANNAFQRSGQPDGVNERAQKEFDFFVETLRAHDVNVLVVQDCKEPHTPDSVFPNNWASYHPDGTVVLYPMFAANRRLERKKNILRVIEESFTVRTIIDLTDYETQQMFLEGTGSMILDRAHGLAYACLSARTHPTVFYDFCERMDYSPVLFSARDKNGDDIYHTNVMMCLGEEYVVICMDSVPPLEEKMLREKFARTKKELITITQEQMQHFAGNMLQLHNKKNEKLLVMSAAAHQSLTQVQIKKLESFNALISVPLPTIEQYGGGSARCMIAEVFLPRK